MSPSPRYLAPGSPPTFPDPRGALRDGLVAFGGDLSPARLLAAYDAGIFPCYGADSPPLWWSPNPRAILAPATLHVSRRLARTLRSSRFALSWNRAFAQVVAGCAEDREGDWILPEVASAYVRLHALGHAHSLEVWRDGGLAGGLYGVQRGALFAAESMFHRESDASKVALVVAVRALFAAGITLLDVQYLTEHLARMGATTLPRTSYLERLAVARARRVDVRELDLDAHRETPPASD